MTEIVVVGAGVVGTSVAFRLAQGGASVTLLEAGRVGGGTSSASFAWTNANNKPPRAYHDLNVEGMRAHAALREEFEDAPWWHGGGSVEWAHGDAERGALRDRAARLRAWNYRVEELTPRDLRALEPDLDPAAVGDAVAVYCPDEGWLDPVVYAHAMAEAAVRAGARLLVDTPAAAIRRGGDRVAGVRARDGREYGADVVVVCAGRWSGALAATAGVTIPLAPTVGLLVTTPPVPSCVRRIVRAPRVHLRPDGGGRLMLQSDDTDAAVSADTAPSPSLPGALELVRRAAEVLPAAAGAHPEAARIGVRSMPADGHSIVGPAPGVAGCYVAVTHSGVTLAPFLGRIIADEILRGRDAPHLAGFRPGRFETPPASSHPCSAHGA